MSSAHEAMSRYYEVRDRAILAGIDASKIEQANVLYARLHVMIVRAKSAPETIPALQEAIMNLPMALIETLDVTADFEEVREAALNLPNGLMDALSPVIDFGCITAE